VISVPEVKHTLARFDNLVALKALLPQPEINANLTLSPVAAAAFEVNVAVIILEFASPESIVALAPKFPTNDQAYPVAAPAVVDAAGQVLVVM
jgi:hypothetical protein